MSDFGVKLDCEERLCSMADRGKRRIGRVGEATECVGDRLKLVPMAHPDREPTAEAGKEIGDVVDQERSPAILPGSGSCRHGAVKVTENPHPIADPQDRYAMFDYLAPAEGRIWLVDTGWTTRENDPFGIKNLHVVRWQVERVDFAVDAQFADAAGDQLRVLRTEIENEDLIHGEAIGVGARCTMPTRAQSTTPLH